MSEDVSTEPLLCSGPGLPGAVWCTVDLHAKRWGQAPFVGVLAKRLCSKHLISKSNLCASELMVGRRLHLTIRKRVWALVGRGWILLPHQLPGTAPESVYWTLEQSTQAPGEDGQGTPAKARVVRTEEDCGARCLFFSVLCTPQPRDPSPHLFVLCKPPKEPLKAPLVWS